MSLPVVAFGDKRIIALGGVDGDGTALSSVEILNVEQNEWQYTTPLPEARAAPGAVVHNNTIYIFGGCGVDGVPLKSGFSLKLTADGAWLHHCCTTAGALTDSLLALFSR